MKKIPIPTAADGVKELNDQLAKNWVIVSFDIGSNTMVLKKKEPVIPVAKPKPRVRPKPKSSPKPTKTRLRTSGKIPTWI